MDKKRLFTVMVCVWIISVSVYAQLTPQENEKGKFGYVNEEGEYVIKAQWDDAENFANGIALVKKGNLYGYINEAGKYVVKPKYTSVGAYNEFDLCKVSTGGSIDKKTDELKGAKYGFIDRNAREIVKPKYSFTGVFNKNGVCWVNVGGKIDKKTGKLKGGKYGYLLDSGVELTKIEYTAVRNTFSESGFAWVQKGKKYGYIDVKGRSVIDVKYENIQDTFKNDLAWVQLKKKYGYINTKGQVICPIKYEKAWAFSDDCAAVGIVAKVNKKKVMRFGFIDISGKEIIEPVYDDVVTTFVEKHSAIAKDGKWAIIDNRGKTISNFEYLNVVIYLKNKGYVCVTKDGKKDKNGAIQSGTWGLMSNEGKLITPIKYRSIGIFNNENLALVSDGSHSGWINLQGKEVIPLMYDNALDFKNGLATVINNKKVSWIDPENKIVLKTDYIDATSFDNEVACVKDNDQKWGGIDIQGNVVVPFFAKDSNEARDVVNTIYAKNGNKSVTKRQVTLYSLYKNPQRKAYNVKNVIPDNLWDF